MNKATSVQRIGFFMLGAGIAHLGVAAGLTSFHAVVVAAVIGLAMVLIDAGRPS